MILAIIIIGAVILLLLVLIVGGGMLINIGGQQVGIIERRYFGRTLPEGRVVAMRFEVGLQARVLPPGLHLLFPFIYVVRKTDMLIVGEDEGGFVGVIDVVPMGPGPTVARRVQCHGAGAEGQEVPSNGGG